MSRNKIGSAWFTDFQKVDAGTRLYRDHLKEIEGKQLLGSEFNPCKGLGDRFSPLHTPEGRCVSTLYAASTFNAAAIEVAYRNYGVPNHSTPPPMYRDEIKKRRATILRPLRDLMLISFLGENLKSNGINAEQIIGPSASYKLCRSFAERVIGENIGVDGIVWESARSVSESGEEWCYVIFDHHHRQYSNEPLFDMELVEDNKYIDDMEGLAKEVGYEMMNGSSKN